MQGLPAGSEARLTVASYLERQRAAEEGDSASASTSSTSSGSADHSSDTPTQSTQRSAGSSETQSSPTLRSSKSSSSASPTNASEQQSSQGSSSQDSDAPSRPLKPDQQLEQQDDSMRQSRQQEDEGDERNQTESNQNKDQSGDRGEGRPVGESQQQDPEEVVDEQIESARRTQFVPEYAEPLSKHIGYKVERPELPENEAEKVRKQLEQARLEEQVQQQEAERQGQLKSPQEYSEALEKEQQKQQHQGQLKQQQYEEADQRDDKFSKDVEQMKQEQQYHLKPELGSTEPKDLDKSGVRRETKKPSSLPRYGEKQQQLGPQQLERPGGIPESEMHVPMRNQPFHHAQYERAKDPAKWTSAEAEAHLAPSHYQTPTAIAIPASEYDQRHISEKAEPLEGSEEIRSGTHEIGHGLAKSWRDFKERVSDTFTIGKHEIARNIEQTAAKARANAEDNLTIKQAEREVDRAADEEVENIKLMGKAADRALEE